MKFNLDTAQGIMIHSSQTGEVVLKRPTGNPAAPFRKESYTNSLLLGSNEQLQDWPVGHISDLSTTHLEPVWAVGPDIVLLGTGKKLIFPAAEVLQGFGTRGIGFEVMDTAAACRTYNVLLAEGRDVMALLIID